MKSLFGGPVRGHLQVELLSAYLDGQTSPAERANIDAHLRECGACQAELESLRRTVTLLQAMPRVAVPRAFTLSEAQVGVRRPEPAPNWFGGLARGLGAVAAVLIVALVAFTVLRPEQAPWSPSAQVARVAPTTAAPVAEVATQPALAATAAENAPAAEPAPFAKSAPAATEAPQTGMASEAPTPEAEQPAALAAAPAPTDAEAFDAATTLAPEATATGEAPMLAQVAATPEPEMGAAAMGLGGGGDGRDAGGGGAGGPGIPSEYLTPEATPPAQPLATAIPTGVRFAYADLNTLWAVDRDGGARQLAQARGINTPRLSPDQQWIAYRIFTDKGAQLWVVRFDGGAPKLVYDDANPPADNLPAGYERRAFSDARWGPGNNTLSVTLTLVPAADQQLPNKLELWLINVDTGNLRFSNELGRAWRPFYSPDGKQYLTVAYGTEEQSDGAVELYETEGGKATSLLTFPDSLSRLAHDNQVAWTTDGQTAWVALPAVDSGRASPPNGAEIYRLSGGQLQKVNDIDAFQVFWSPDAGQMAYTRYTSESMSGNELYLANADGSNAEVYAAMTDGQFISWSPTGKRFLYQDTYQIFVGERGKPPARLANAVSMVNPRWISDDLLAAAHDTGDGWLLALRNIDGSAVGLLPLPREAIWDVGAQG